jgi:hypothetical protein
MLTYPPETFFVVDETFLLLPGGGYIRYLRHIVGKDLPRDR